MKDTRPYWRRTMRPQQRNQGFTLIELVMAIVLGALISGVIVAAIITSLNIADSTSAQVKDSTDASLISAFLYRDAQAAGGTDPAKAQLDSTLGVSTTDSGTCGVPAGSTLVVRFSWLDRQTVSAKRVMLATYSFNSSTKQLTRRICQDGVNSDSVLARALNTATATCSPACTGLPSYVTLAMAGSGTRSPFSYSLSASLRPQTQVRPTTGTASTVALLALGGAASSCPNLSRGGTSTITALGDVTVASECSSSPAMSGAQTISFSGNGSISTLSGLADPFITLTPPAGTCSGANPTVGTPGTYPNAVTITTAVTFTAGTYVFCNGLTLGAGAAITGTGVFMYFKQSGTLTVDTAATIDLTPNTSGSYANLLAWVATSGQTIAIVSGTQVSSYRGMLYAPSSTVAVSGAGATNIGGIVAKTINFSDTGVSTRLGLPIPVMNISPATLPIGTVNVPYASTTLSAAGGTAPYSWTWAAPALPAGLSLSSAGVISGTPTAAGTFVVTVTALDVTKAAVSKTYIVTIAPPLAITCGTLPTGTANVAYTSGATLSATGGTLPYVWSAASLPSGLTINNSGVISGTPVAFGTFNLSIQVTDANNVGASCSRTLTINAPVSLPVGQNIQTTPSSPSGNGMTAGDVINFSYQGLVKPDLIFAGWDGSTPKTVYVRYGSGNMFNSPPRPTTSDFVDIFSSYSVLNNGTSASCTAVSKKAVPVAGDINVGAISMSQRDKYYGGGALVVYQATMTATTDTITVTLVAKMCPGSIAVVNPQAANMVWYPTGSGTAITETDPVGQVPSPDVDF